MKRILTAVVLIPLVLYLTFKAPLWLFCAVVAIVAMLAMREYMDLVVGYGYEPMAFTTFLITPLYFALLAVLAEGVDNQEIAGTFFLLSGALTLPVAFFYALMGLRKELK